MMSAIAIATEDELSEEVAIRLIRERNTSSEIEPRFGRRGFGYLKANMEKFCALAMRRPMLVLTDLDRGSCPQILKDAWLGQRTPPGNLLFRVAVRETEAWLLADHEAMAGLLGVSSKLIPLKPDELEDPKRSLLELARRAPRDVRDDLLPPRNAVASQGLGYNRRLGEFVRDIWSPERAAMRSDSLKRARLRLLNILA